MRTLSVIAILLLCGVAGAIAWLEWGPDSSRPDGPESQRAARRAAAVVSLPPASVAAQTQRPPDKTSNEAEPDTSRKLVYFDPSLVEDGPHGPIPRIGPGGERPADVYASPFPAAADTAKAGEAKAGRENPGPAKTRHPRIAIVMTGLGLKADLTQTALKALPGPVTLAFSAYAPDLYDWTRSARTEGHEVMVEAPFQPRDPKRDDSGPKALKASLSESENFARLNWVMSRFVGYVGVIGARDEGLSAKADAFIPLVDDVLGRGLLYLHPQTEAPALAAIGKDRGLLRVDLWLDTSREPESLDRRMRIAEALARGRGWVVVAVRATPQVVDSVRQWVAAMPDRELAAAPITAVTHDALRAADTP